MDINKILIINHSVWHHNKKSHLPIIANELNNIFNKNNSNYKVVNTSTHNLRSAMISHKEYPVKYIIVYGAEVKMLEGFLASYLRLSIQYRYVIYFGMFLVNDSPKRLNQILDRYMKANIRFFVDSFMLQKALKHKIPLCFPFLCKDTFNKINTTNEIKTRKNTVFINLRKLSYPWLISPNKRRATILYGLINLIKFNPDHYFYVDNQINKDLASIFRDNLRGGKNWEFINPSDDYEKYLKHKKGIEKHIMLLVAWNIYRTSGNILEMVGLNRTIIILTENNWACNFLHTIKYPNVVYVKSFFNLPLKELPEIQEYDLYNTFINSHSVESILNLIPEARWLEAKKLKEKELKRLEPIKEETDEDIKKEEEKTPKQKEEEPKEEESSSANP